MLQLTWLKINKFRNVKPGTELHFVPKFNVLLGKNASGKTTLLDLVASISNDSLFKYEAEEAEGFDIEYRYGAEDCSFRVRTSHLPSMDSYAGQDTLQTLGIAAEPSKRRTWTLEVVDSNNFRLCSCEVDGNIAKYTLGTECKYEHVVPPEVSAKWSIQECLLNAWNECPSEETKKPLAPLVVMSWLRRMVNFSLRYGEALDEFHMMTCAMVTLRKSYLDSVFMPLEVTNALQERLKKSPDNYPTVFLFSEVQALARVLPLLGFASGEFRPQLARRVSNNGDSTYEFKNVEFLLARQTGDMIRADLLSFGQKRLLAFFWYLAVRGDLPVVADELANGLHHEWIEACVKELSERQSFLATQNPLLLDYLPAGMPDTTLVHCSTDSTNGHGTMCWRNFNEDEQKRLDTAYSVGIQQVSEILRSEGLW